MTRRRFRTRQVEDIREQALLMIDAPQKFTNTAVASWNRGIRWGKPLLSQGFHEFGSVLLLVYSLTAGSANEMSGTEGSICIPRYGEHR